jgi:hypothetical protein
MSPRFLTTTACRRLTAAGALVALAASLVTAPAPAMAASAAAVKPPVVPSGLPAGIEKLAGYVGVNSCDPTMKPGTAALGNLLRATYPGTSYGISRTCGSVANSEHYEGRAVDWMASMRKPAQALQAISGVKWLLSKDRSGYNYGNARRVGVMYIIWNNKIWRAYDPVGGWKPYKNCASLPKVSSDTYCHRDHVHISLSWEGAMKRTSFWSKRIAGPEYGPCRVRDLNWAASYAAARWSRCTRYSQVSAPARASTLLKSLTACSGQVLRVGSQGAGVKAVQQALRTTANGTFGTGTKAAVVKWQKARGIPADGVVRASTWRALLRTFKPVA